MHSNRNQGRGVGMKSPINQTGGKMNKKLRLLKLYKLRDKIDEKIRDCKIELRRETLDEIWREKVVRK